MKKMCPMPKATKPNTVYKYSFLRIIYLRSRNTSPNNPKNNPIKTKIPKVLFGLCDVNHATSAVMINIKDVKPLKTTAITRFSFTRKIRNAIKNMTPIEIGINIIY